MVTGCESELAVDFYPCADPKCRYRREGLIRQVVASNGDKYLLYSNEVVIVSRDCEFVIHSDYPFVTPENPTKAANPETAEKALNAETAEQAQQAVLIPWDMALDEKSNSVVVVFEGLFLIVFEMGTLALQQVPQYLFGSPTSTPRARAGKSVNSLFPGLPTILVDWDTAWYFVGFIPDLIKDANLIPRPTRPVAVKFGEQHISCKAQLEANADDPALCYLVNPVWYNDWRNGVDMFITKSPQDCTHVRLGAAYIRNIVDDQAYYWCDADVELPRCARGFISKFYGAKNPDRNWLYFNMAGSRLKLTMLRLDYEFRPIRPAGLLEAKK